ncbi:MAG: 3-dehydroquinate synthase [Alphaproteobacteria bacterium]|jgi:3-dehydroquinate synthase|nr:3-dehydroquinate synthase [Alphaproteobacteria bacterium]
MDNSIKVNVRNPYEIYFTSMESIPTTLASITSQRNIVLIVDKNLEKNHLPHFLKSLKNMGFNPSVLLIHASEKNKSMKMATNLINKILRLQINRSTPIIAFGGGIVGDIAGFCASVIYRGLPFFQIPTTLLAMVDSSVGGKVGVNTRQGKNTVGSFYQPKAVFIDVAMLETLPSRDYKSGYAEVLKYSLLFSKDYFKYLDSHYKLFLDKNQDYLMNIIKNSCGFKAKVVEEDELETQDVRFLLNLGHTFAHALESYNNYKPNLIHGEAVSIGMVLAFKLSANLGLCSTENYDKIKEHLTNIGLPVAMANVFKRINTKKIIKLMSKDKKNHSSHITLILAEDIGKCIVKKDTETVILKNFLDGAFNG